MQHKPKHIVQSPDWAQFKTLYGTKSIECGGVYYTTHKVPFTPFNVAYCPKVDPLTINWEKLRESLKKNKCSHINFDCPNVLTIDSNYKDAVLLMEKHCVKSPKGTFAKHTVLIDISKGEDTVMENMHSKHRYNIKYAQKNNIEIVKAENLNDYNIFYDMLEATALREKYYVHSRRYYREIWEVLHPKGMCDILISKLGTKSLSAWMLLNYESVLYYPYGASSGELKNLCHGNLLGWEAIRYGIDRGCKSFDMWGALDNLNDTSHPWWGFTNFKMKYGGKLVEFMDSYDMVVDKKTYQLFNFANDMRWKILRLIR